MFTFSTFGTRLAISRNSVVFPTPLGPSIHVHSAAGRTNLMFSNSKLFPKARRSAVTEIEKAFFEGNLLTHLFLRRF